MTAAQERALRDCVSAAKAELDAHMGEPWIEVSREVLAGIVRNGEAALEVARKEPKTMTDPFSPATLRKLAEAAPDKCTQPGDISARYAFEDYVYQHRVALIALAERAEGKSVTIPAGSDG